MTDVSVTKASALLGVSSHTLSRRISDIKDWGQMFEDRRSIKGQGTTRYLSITDMVVLQMLVDTHSMFLIDTKKALAEMIRLLADHRPVEVRVFPADEVMITYRPNWSYLNAE